LALPHERGEGVIPAAANTDAGATTVEEGLPRDVTPEDLLREFEHKLQGDVKAVGTTITAITGVIVFWRGVWSLLDSLLGDSVFGDVACIVVGLLTVLGIRLSGAKMSSFWPTS